ncbi:hypothetical protein [Shewanella mangrovisoli]|uniref:hypothetical protein n=1 Tax=Shewanella mangrovisoli TaxID=2864211 RepID=UPI0035B9D5E4
MKQRPIIFNTEMVRAILDGRKTQTRRPMNPQPKPDTETSLGGYWFPCAAFQSMVHVEDLKNPLWRGMASDACPICSVGDQLWVRETFADCGPRLTYKADEDDGAHCVVKRWTPSIHMPRSAARIILEVTDIRVERVKDIKEQDAIAEGMAFTNYGLNQFGNQLPGWLWRNSNKHEECLSSAKWAFLNLWESIYGEQSWQSNPWVWVIEFRVFSTTGGAA